MTRCQRHQWRIPLLYSPPFKCFLYARTFLNSQLLFWRSWQEFHNWTFIKPTLHFKLAEADFTWLQLFEAFKKALNCFTSRRKYGLSLIYAKCFQMLCLRLRGGKEKKEKKSWSYLCKMLCHCVYSSAFITRLTPRPKSVCFLLSVSRWQMKPSHALVILVIGWTMGVSAMKSR